jgi:hypothetical protein
MSPDLRCSHLAEVLLYLIEKGPDRTEAELAAAIYGPDAPQQHVNQDCRLLVGKGKIERRGSGGPSDPYRYHLVSKQSGRPI